MTTAADLTALGWYFGQSRLWAFKKPVTASAVTSTKDTSKAVS
jgi:hypothetical protein